MFPSPCQSQGSKGSEERNPGEVKVKSRVNELNGDEGGTRALPEHKYLGIATWLLSRAGLLAPALLFSVSSTPRAARSFLLPFCTYFLHVKHLNN